MLGGGVIVLANRINLSYILINQLRNMPLLCQQVQNNYAGQWRTQYFPEGASTAKGETLTYYLAFFAENYLKMKNVGLV